MDDARRLGGVRDRGDPGDVAVDDEDEVGIGQSRAVPNPQVERVIRREVHVRPRVHLDDRQGELVGQRDQPGDGVRPAAGVTRDHERPLGCAEPPGHGGQRPLLRNGGHGGWRRRGIREVDKGQRLGKDLAGRGQIHGTGRIGRGEPECPPDHLADVRRAVEFVLPLHVLPHDAGLIEDILNELHVAVPGPGELAAIGERRPPREDEHRNAATRGIVHSPAQIGRAGVHVDDDGLGATGDLSEPMGRADGHRLMGADDQGRHGLLSRPELRKGLDQGRMVRAEVDEDELDPVGVKGFDEGVGGGLNGDTAGRAGALGHAQHIPTLRCVRPLLLRIGPRRRVEGDCPIHRKPSHNTRRWTRGRAR